ncbi:MAG: universal stress protein [Anaerolineales bacterium]|nr:universal stress protein [Anaerolineales bacterium]
MYKRILVPLDGSKRAERILPHVEDLAAKEAATVILLYVVDPGLVPFTPGMSMGMAPAPQELELYWQSLQEAEQDADKYLQTQAARLAKHKIKTENLVRRGDPVNAIVSASEEENVDLIAMSSHGRTGLERVFYGSVTSGVLHKVDRPLLLIRAQKEE